MNRRTLLAGVAGIVATPAATPAVAVATEPANLTATMAAPVAVAVAGLMDTGGRTWPATGPAMSAWSALPTPCVVCGQTVEYMAVVAGGYACLPGLGQACADLMATPTSLAGWPCNIPPDWPVWRMPDGHRCRHCGRAGVAAIEWPRSGWWTCAPGGAAGFGECVCARAACCGEPERVGDQLQAFRGAEPPVTLGRIERIDGPVGRRMFLVSRSGEPWRWYAERDLVL